MASSLGELFIELGVFADTKELQQFEKGLEKVKKTIEETKKENDKLSKSVKSFVKGIAGVAGALGGALFALNKLTSSLIANNQEFLNLTRNSDVALGTFQKWDNIGRMFGVKNAAQQVANLNQRLFELKLTGQGAEGFILAGINPLGQDAEGIMEQLRNRVAGLSDSAATFLLTQMGLDPSMLHLLRMGRKEFEELGKAVEKYQLTEDQRKDIQKMNVQFEIARMKLQYLKDRAILAIMPYFVRFMQSLTRVAELLANLGENFGKFVIKWRGLVSLFTLGLSKIKPIATLFTAISKAFGELIIKIPIFGRYLGMLGKFAAKALLPFTALYLLLDDLAVFFQGGDSLIGRVIKWGQEKGGEIADAFKKMFGGDLFGGIGDLAKTLVDTLQELLGAALRIIDILLGTSIKVTVMKTLDWVKEMITNNPRTQEEFDQLYRNYAPDWAKAIYTPNIPNQTTNNSDSRQFTMHNVINTSDTASTLQNLLQPSYIQDFAFSAFPTQR